MESPSERSEESKWSSTKIRKDFSGVASSILATISLGLGYLTFFGTNDHQDPDCGDDEQLCANTISERSNYLRYGLGGLASGLAAWGAYKLFQRFLTVEPDRKKHEPIPS